MSDEETTAHTEQLPFLIERTVMLAIEHHKYTLVISNETRVTQILEASDGDSMVLAAVVVIMAELVFKAKASKQ